MNLLPGARRLGAMLGAALLAVSHQHDAADDLLCVDLGGRRIIKKKTERGSRFELLFPIALPNESAPSPQQDHLKVQAGWGQRIWVLDDEPAVARYLDELLKDSGYSVRLFNEPFQVLAAFEIEKN